MSDRTKNLSKQAGQPLHDQFVAMVAKLFAESGWHISYDAVAMTPSGSPVRADLKAHTPEGQELFFEFKIGNSKDYLPMSAYAQGAQLNRSGIPAILVTNMKVADPLAELFRESRIPVIKTTVDFEQRAFLDSLRSAAAINPEIVVGDRKRF